MPPSVRWVHPIFLGSAATEQKSLQSMISDLRLFSMQHSTASRALASAFNRRHPVWPRKKIGCTPCDNKFVISKKILKFLKISIYISFQMIYMIHHW